MKTLTARIQQFISLIHSIKTKNLEWLSENQDQKIKLSHNKILAEENLKATLAKRNAQLAHEVDLLKTRQQAELAMLKTRCKEDIKDYQEYLESLHQLKLTIKASFAHLPDAVTLTIHHHAKSLLNAMWETENLQEKIRLETQLIEFMSTVHEEARLYRTGTLPGKLPEITLQLINQNRNQTLQH